MSENDISSLSLGGYSLPTRLSQPGFQPASQAVSQASSMTQESDRRTKSNSPVDRDASSRTKSDVSLEFKVDPDNQDVTVLILDKKSRKVIRTIPPEELSKLREGDLVELFG
jgi:uncharacterized FlaG/YvyC family protein